MYAAKEQTTMNDTQPDTNDYRNRIARPVLCRTLAQYHHESVDNEANAFAMRVADAGGEVLGIVPAIHTDASGDYPTTLHYRTVTYRHKAPL